MPAMVIVVQHEPGEGAGTLLPHLGEVQLVRIWAGDPVPRTLGSARGLVVLGGGMGAYEQDRLPHLRDEIALLQAAVAAEKPVLGICLGSQLLAASLGATVAPTGRQEIGWYRVKLAAADDALFAEAPRDFVAFHWHGDAFTLPPGATPLASSTMTPLQAFRFGARAWGVMFHLETDADVLGAMVATGGLEGDGEVILSAAPRELPRLRAVADGVFARWAALL
jgi:GMP synthase (glutamine-hydrolysing)